MPRLTPDTEYPYLSSGDQQLQPQDLLKLLGVFRNMDQSDIKGRLTHANVCMELATTARYRQAAGVLLEEADGAFIAAEQVPTCPKDFGFRRMQLHAAMQRSFLPLFEKVLCREAPVDLEDQHVLLTNLQAACTNERVADSMALNPHPNGKLWPEWYTIMTHEISARQNLREGEITHHTWPSFTRFSVQGQPGRQEVRRDWDIAASTSDFLAPDFQKIKVIGTRSAMKLHHAVPVFAPDIRRVSVREDMGVSNVRQALGDIRQEHGLMLRDEAGIASPAELSRLAQLERTVDNYGYYFLAAMGITALEGEQ